MDERAKLTAFRQWHKTHPKRSPSASKKSSQVTLPDSPTPPISTKRYGTSKCLSFFKLVQMIKGDKDPVQNEDTLLYGTSGFVDARISNFRIRPRTLI